MDIVNGLSRFLLRLGRDCRLRFGSLDIYIHDHPIFMGVGIHFAAVVIRDVHKGPVRHELVFEDFFRIRLALGIFIRWTCRLSSARA